MGVAESRKLGGPSMDDLIVRVEEQLGKLAVSSRFHRLPTVIGDHYNISTKVLGTGISGPVHLARSKFEGSSHQRKCAVKSFKCIGLAPNMRQHLHSEVEIFLGMDHPHITRLYDVYETKESLQMVMECLEGGELFDRISQLQQFSESDAARAVWQMLLAINYLHGKGIVHRDIKMENFLYDAKGSNHLKLIDFGFSKVYDGSENMSAICGTLSYLAPEVLAKAYTVKCDIWSLGVICFVLLAGYMPFSGPEVKQKRDILAGRCKMHREKWDEISMEARQFTKLLLQVDPEKRLSAAEALKQPWLECRDHSQERQMDIKTALALKQFGSASKFRRCCMEMMAWSLSNDELAEVRQMFLALDVNQRGTITLGDLKGVLLEKFDMDDDEVVQIFQALSGPSQTEEIHYTDFLAAMLDTRITLHDDMLLNAFRRFDVDHTGFITVENMYDLLGETFEGEEIEDVVREANIFRNGQVGYQEFVRYLRGTEHGANRATRIIDRELAKDGQPRSVRYSARMSRYHAPEPGAKPRLPSVPAAAPYRSHDIGCFPCLLGPIRRLRVTWRRWQRRRRSTTGHRSPNQRSPNGSASPFGM